MNHYVFLFSLLLMGVAAFDDNTVEDVKKTISKGLAELPDNIKDAIPVGLNENDIPSIEEGEEMLKERCERYGTNESFSRAMVAKEEVQFCFQGLINFTEAQMEIERAKPTGALEVVFRKYCRKAPQIRGCVANFTNGIEPCLSPDERSMKETITNITESLIHFICYKEGDRIALFISEEGPECLKNKQEQIQQCVNSSFSHYIPTETSDKNELPMFKLGDAECGDVDKLQKCVLRELSTCPQPTPANIVDSLFTYVRKGTPCSQKDGASLATVNGFILSLSAVLALVTLFH